MACSGPANAVEVGLAYSDAFVEAVIVEAKLHHRYQDPPPPADVVGVARTKKVFYGEAPETFTFYAVEYNNCRSRVEVGASYGFFLREGRTPVVAMYSGNKQMSSYSYEERVAIYAKENEASQAAR